MADTARNKEIVRRWITEAWGRGDADLQDDLLAADIVDHNPAPGLAPGREGQKQLVRLFAAAFDIDIKNDLLLADGDYVVYRNTNHLLHKGDFMGIPPTGRRATMTGTGICRLAGGRIVELWHQEDSIGLMQQLGVISAPP